MDGRVLVAAARAAIAHALGVADGVRAPDAPPDWAVPERVRRHGDTPDWAARDGASFVTLTLDGRLRGCIGSLSPRRPLIDDVRANAVAAAFDDPRFPGLTRPEFERVRVEVSVLSLPEPLAVADEDDLVAQLVPHRDGVILQAGRRRATFLPQVWEQLPEPRAFLAALKRKAGLPETYWGPDVRVSRYRVEAFEESGRP